MGPEARLGSSGTRGSDRWDPRLGSDRWDPRLGSRRGRPVLFKRGWMIPSSSTVTPTSQTSTRGSNTPRNTTHQNRPIPPDQTRAQQTKPRPTRPDQTRPYPIRPDRTCYEDPDLVTRTEAARVHGAVMTTRDFMI